MHVRNEIIHLLRNLLQVDDVKSCLKRITLHIFQASPWNTNLIEFRLLPSSVHQTKS